MSSLRLGGWGFDLWLNIPKISTDGSHCRSCVNLLNCLWIVILSDRSLSFVLQPCVTFPTVFHWFLLVTQMVCWCLVPGWYQIVFTLYCGRLKLTMAVQRCPPVTWVKMRRMIRAISEPRTFTQKNKQTNKKTSPYWEFRVFGLPSWTEPEQTQEEHFLFSGWLHRMQFYS